MFRGCRIAAGEGFEAPEAGSEAARSLQQLLSRLWKQIPRLQDRCGGLGSLWESGSLQGSEPGALQEAGSLNMASSVLSMRPCATNFLTSVARGFACEPGLRNH